MARVASGLPKLSIARALRRIRGVNRACFRAHSHALFLKAATYPQFADQTCLDPPRNQVPSVHRENDLPRRCP